MMRRARRWVLVAGLWLAPWAASVGIAPAALAAEAERAPERWRGVASLPGLELEFFVTLRAGEGGALEGRLDIPAQGLAGGALSDVERTETGIKFRFAPEGAPYPAEFELTRAAGSDEASGVLRQAKQEFPVTLKRMAEGERAGGQPPARAQDPRPPFPYTEREVSFTSPADGVTIAGTLTIPEGRGAGGHPAVVLLTGSGAQDRDETIFGHRPFRVIADHLARHGIASLRCDDRGVGGTGGDLMTSTLETLAQDALGAVQFVRAQAEIDAKRVGLVGHSEGGIIAPMVAARSADVAFIALLAGTGVEGWRVWTGQIDAILRKAGAPAEMVERQGAARRELVDAVLADADEAALRERIAAVVRASVPAEQAGAVTDEQVAQAAEGQAAVIASAWFRSFMKSDPATALRGVRCPVLAMNGSKDLQVLAEQNLIGIERALHEGGNRDVTILELPGLNHLFQACETGALEEYGLIEETFNPAALEALSAWLRDKAGVRGGGAGAVTR